MSGREKGLESGIWMVESGTLQVLISRMNLIYRASSTGQFAKDYALKNQIRRAALSISSNIAEGQGRFGPKEFRNYLSIANGSIYEVISQVHFARDLGYVTPIEAEDILARCSEVSRMVKGLRNSI